MKVKIIQKLWDATLNQYTEMSKDVVDTTPGQRFTLSPIFPHALVVEEWGDALEVTVYTHPNDVGVRGKLEDEPND